MTLLLLVAGGALLCPILRGAARGTGSDIDPSQRAKQRSSAGAESSSLPTRSYSRFTHHVAKHKQACDSCHKFPSSNWNRHARETMLSRMSPTIRSTPPACSAIASSSSVVRHQPFAPVATLSPLLATAPGILSRIHETYSTHRRKVKAHLRSTKSIFHTRSTKAYSDNASRAWRASDVTASSPFHGVLGLLGFKLERMIAARSVTKPTSRRAIPMKSSSQRPQRI